MITYNFNPKWNTYKILYIVCTVKNTTIISDFGGKNVVNSTIILQYVYVYN